MEPVVSKPGSGKSARPATVRHPVASRGAKVGRVSHSGGGKPRHGGLVDHLVLGPSGAVSARACAPSGLIQSLQDGLPFQELADLRRQLDVSMERLALILGLSKATLHRRKRSGRLDTAESDRVVRFARLLGKASAVLESTDNARQWLSAPQVGLGHAIPLDYARTEVGAREVEDLLGRIEFGAYS